MSQPDPPAPDLGARTPLAPEERRQYCAHIVELDRPGLMRLVGRYEATVYAQATRLAAVEAERDQQTALVRQWDERDHEKTIRIAALERERAFFAWRVGDLEDWLLQLGLQPEPRAAVVQRWWAVDAGPGGAGAGEASDGD